jgi:hypothetical protein
VKAQAPVQWSKSDSRRLGQSESCYEYDYDGTRRGSIYGVVFDIIQEE